MRGNGAGIRRVAGGAHEVGSGKVGLAGSEVFTKEGDGGSQPSRVGLSTNAVDAAILNNSAVYSWWLRCGKSEIADRKGTVTDVVEAVVAPGGLNKSSARCRNDISIGSSCLTL